jgi:hypothetical protein
MLPVSPGTPPVNAHIKERYPGRCPEPDMQYPKLNSPPPNSINNPQKLPEPGTIPVKKYPNIIFSNKNILAETAAAYRQP